MEKLCTNNLCGNSSEFSVEGPSIFDDEKASCSTSDIEGIMQSRLERCDYYNADDWECVSYIHEEVRRSCGLFISCLITTRDDYASWRTYDAFTSRYVKMIKKIILKKV